MVLKLGKYGTLAFASGFQPDGWTWCLLSCKSKIYVLDLVSLVDFLSVRLRKAHSLTMDSLLTSIRSEILETINGLQSVKRFLQSIHFINSIAEFANIESMPLDVLLDTSLTLISWDRPSNRCHWRSIDAQLKFGFST